MGNQTEMQQMPTSKIRATFFSYVFRGHREIWTVLTRFVFCFLFFQSFPLPPWISTIILLDFNFLIGVAYKKAEEREILVKLNLFSSQVTDNNITMITGLLIASY